MPLLTKDTEIKMKEDWWKIHANLGYAFAIFCIGVPIWIATTTVYRANLPYDSIAALDEPQLSLSILLISKDAQDHQIGPALQKALQDSSRLLKIDFRSRLRSELEEDAFLAYTSLQELDQRLLQLHTKSNSIILFEAPAIFFAPKDKRILAFGNGKTLLYKSGCQVQELIKALKSVIGIDKLDNIATAIDSPTRKGCLSLLLYFRKL